MPRSEDMSFYKCSDDNTYIDEIYCEGKEEEKEEIKGEGEGQRKGERQREEDRERKRKRTE